MDRRRANKTQQQAALSPRIVGILFKNLSTQQSCVFDICKIKIFFQPFLLRVQADFVFPIAKQPLDLDQLHGQ